MKRAHFRRALPRDPLDLTRVRETRDHEIAGVMVLLLRGEANEHAVSICTDLAVLPKVVAFG
jgi:hypothetical protein